VLSVNALYGGTDPALVVQRVREHAVDVLSVQELTAAFATELDAAGLAAELPHRVLRPGEGPSGTGLYARVPLRETPLPGPPGLLAQVAASAEFGPLRVELVAAHPPAPLPRRLEATWAAELAALPPAPVPDDGTLRIMAGDFNATLDHAQLRRLLATGYVDAAAATGAGLRPTWPRDGWPPAIFGVTIDHVLAGPADRVRVAAYDTWDQPDSDHRAVYADLVLH
jgi:endonuclease/exonuclease/phosphatase family metal-dependent hydrolase